MNSIRFPSVIHIRALVSTLRNAIATPLPVVSMIVAGAMLAIGFEASAACVLNAGPKSNPLSYTDPGDGTIIYSGSGLQWSKCVFGVSGATCTTGSQANLNWSSAMTAAAASTLAGYTDWRLPNRQELASIIEDTCASPSFAPVFANMPGGQIWSSTTVTPTEAFTQSSTSGIDFVDPKTNLGIVLLVRGGNGAVAYDAMAPANVTVAGPASGNVTQGQPFDVTVTTSFPLFEAVTFSLSVQAGSPAGALTGGVACTIAANQSSCTAPGVVFSGVSGPPLTLAVGSSGGANTLTFASVPVLNVLPSPQSITLTPPASATQFAPFDVGLTLASAVTSTTTFALTKVSGPFGPLGGTLTCSVPANGTTCTFAGVIFTGYGNNLELTASPTSGPAIPVTNVAFNVTSQPYNLTMSAPTQAVQGAPFSLVMTISPPAPTAVTVDVLKSFGPSGALSGPQQCVIPSGGTTCTVAGVSFPSLGMLGLTTSTGSAYSLDLVPPSATVEIILPTYTITLVAPPTGQQGIPFNVTLVSNQAVAFAVPLTLSLVSGSASGSLGGNLACTIAVGQTSCTITGVTFSGTGNIMLTAGTPAEGALFAYERAAMSFALAIPLVVPTLGAAGLLTLLFAAMLIGGAVLRRRMPR